MYQGVMGRYASYDWQSGGIMCCIYLHLHVDCSLSLSREILGRLIGKLS